ncbi:hypothetical protein BL250_03360 [Erwinia sp. OLTSP20]|uniref:DUF1176 domain-containing protein n=1 Tax=unclassified Erwinia TaxID=2622719 RepID=UPI000C18AD90|nr:MULTISPECIES: DUF1176 domain-containing protein [unclassified Erwinia]PIJ51578.1 hypothetical protein BV501_03885 [Erwinia sp. OAMSP11]PIJ75836.1 hypothetical protein BK416_00370 [Erwinia sp. OLSSP12]PIJ83488.1 hypothetical protein BLD47_04880 [Erwinia sp. OLCASP19]PIJ86321.1 hypothetical protein BLD46_04310 [Erwinia sp. OLMTSP26]PIJ88436.1 hypothetical protein BLD49_01560 [Erwinia sp. OLMDSP33]
MPRWMKFFLSLSLLHAASLHAEPLQKVISDWQITCNNLNYCVARNIPGDNGLVMTISRHAGNNDRALIRIDYGNRYSGELAGGPLKDNLLLDQKRLKLDLKHWQVAAHHLSTAHTISLEEFLAQIMDADNIQLLYRQGATISLHGLKPALALMDEIQGRVNSQGAFVKRGDRPADAVPPEPVTPKVYPQPHPPAALTRDEASGLIDFGTWRINTDECSLDPQRRQVSVSPLTDDKALLLISCEMGAYNVIDLAFEITRVQPYVAKGISLKLPFTAPGQAEKDLELVNAEYDAASGELLTFSKDRGLGDCGVATRWQFDGGQFQLADYAREGTCDAWHSSDDWPALWTTVVAREPAATVSLEPQPAS